MPPSLISLAQAKLDNLTAGAVSIVALKLMDDFDSSINEFMELGLV
jgi:hypothetical protein